MHLPALKLLLVVSLASFLLLWNTSTARAAPESTPGSQQLGHILQAIGTPIPAAQTPSLASVLEEIRRETNTQESDSVFDQGHSKEDRNITAEIRRRINANDTFSSNAKNIMIVTKDHVVTLRGRVTSHGERSAIIDIAESLAGPANVTNEMEIP